MVNNELLAVAKRLKERSDSTKEELKHLADSDYKRYVNEFYTDLEVAISCIERVAYSNLDD